MFADMGMPNAGEWLFKADLAITISRIIEDRKLSQSRAAALVAVDQPKISALMHGDTRGFSVDRLLKLLTLLGQDIDICVHSAKGAKGRVRVAA